jgi:hypothetical protein
VATDTAKIERELSVRCCLTRKKSFFDGLKRECINLETFESLSDVLVNVPVFVEVVSHPKGAAHLIRQTRGAAGGGKTLAVEGVHEVVHQGHQRVDDDFE